MLRYAIAGIAVAVVLTVLCTAMFGSPELSERAFRLLRWIGNRLSRQDPGMRKPRGSS